VWVAGGGRGPTPPTRNKGRRVMEFDYVICGGGSAGCVMASRLSEDPARRVLLVEAGKDIPPGSEPADVLDSYPMAAAFNPAYHWTKLRAGFSRPGGNEPRDPYPARFMEQARVMGGGSSINAQLANRGGPDDYNEWAELGAEGWGWDEVLPYFRKLETDLDFADPTIHGQDGPIPIRRVPEPQWTDFSRAAAKALEAGGFAKLDDQNGAFRDGWFPTSISNRDEHRVSAAMGYLTDAVRRRPNLEIVSEAQVEALLFEGRRAAGLRYRRGGRAEEVRAGEVIVSAGALHSPAILMRAGIGRAAHLREHGIDMLADRPGVGANLCEHPSLAVSAYLKRGARLMEMGRRHVHIGFRYSSGLPDCGAQDMYVSVTAKSAWHAVGVRLGSFLMWVNKSYSRGAVTLASSSAADEPVVNFEMLSDRRDLERLKDGVRRSVAIFAMPALAAVATSVFPTSYSERVRRIGTVNTKNRILTNILGTLLDSPEPLRRLFIKGFITEGLDMRTLLADEAAMEDWIRASVAGTWHPSCTCRMGSKDDPMAVTDPAGRVIGVENLRVVDASIFPCVPRANTNIPVLMTAEKVADAVKAGR
jgi:5-(hydroxymethyl)furfural/furfural oxidase